MPKPPVPVVFLYDPDEFWEHIRQLIREEIAASTTRQAIYTEQDIARLFQITLETIEDWTRRGILKPVKIRREVYFLHSDLQHRYGFAAGNSLVLETSWVASHGRSTNSFGSWRQGTRNRLLPMGVNKDIRSSSFSHPKENSIISGNFFMPCSLFGKHTAQMPGRPTRL
jgi:hypothetical protein